MIRDRKDKKSYYLIRRLQKKFLAENSFEPQNKLKTDKLQDGRSLISDIKYGETYPNSYLDIYLCKDSKIVKHPTFFYVHGGGYTWGDKKDGDPNGEGRGFGWYFREILNAGYNIVSMNYAFAPEYPYPTPVLQMGEAVHFLQSHGNEYGVDMSEVILSGGSAGGQLIGQFANIQTNIPYAEKMKITPVLEKGTIKGMVLSSALLNPERFGKTEYFLSDYLFTKCGQAYFKCRRLLGNSKAIQADVIRNVTEDFPPCFISDANTASFSDQAYALKEKMDAFGIRNFLNIYPKNEVKLMHGFEYEDTIYAKENLKKTLEFFNIKL